MKRKLKIFWILCLVLIQYLLRGKADKRRSIQKVLILDGGKLGDMICATPVFHAIKEKYPHCKVVVVGNKVNKITLEHNPDVDSYIELDEEDVFKTIAKIKKENADFGCIVSPGAVGLAMLYLSDIPLIAAPVVTVGWSPYETQSYKIMARFVVTKDYEVGQYMPLQFLKLLEIIDIFATSTKKYVYWSKEADVKMEELISAIKKKRELLVGIMPGAGNKIKQWPAERFAEVANYLIEKHNAHIFIIGNDSNRNEIDAMSVGIEKKSETTDCTRVSLDELKALISKLSMTVSVDTGPIFIAEACGVPTIDIGGVIHRQDQAPNDGEFHILITYDGEPLLWSMNCRVYDYEKVRAGTESISVTTVTQTADELIHKIEERRSN